jgi:RNA polymerase sigma-70 factor (ECF subfamily)
MVAHSASFVRPFPPSLGDEAQANVSQALARLAEIAPARRSVRVAGASDAASANAAADRSTVRVAGEGSPPSGVQLSPGRRRGAALEDAALVRATLDGDPRGPSAIWSRYAPLVRSKLTRSIGRQDVEDQVQEVFLRLFEYIGQLRDPNALRSFIIGITLRIAGTELRRRRCRWWLSLTATGELPEPPAIDDPEARRVVSRLFGILDKLAPESSRVFELRYVEEKELTEVATAMNVSLATAKRYLSRVSARVHAMAEREPMLAGYLRTG